MQGQTIFQQVRNPASAAIAGIIFSVILFAVLVQFHTAVPGGGVTTEWLLESGRRRGVSTAVHLIPFAGIAFLWFIGVIRARLGDGEDKLFATVFLGSGLLFVALLFVTASMLATALALYDRGVLVDADTVVAMVLLTKALMGMFGMRMAAVFTLAVSSIGLRTAVLPKWLVLLGYGAALMMLISPFLSRWTQMAFPLWVMVFSIHALVAGRLPQQRTAEVSG